MENNSTIISRIVEFASQLNDEQITEFERLMTMTEVSHEAVQVAALAIRATRKIAAGNAPPKRGRPTRKKAPAAAGG